MQEKVSAFFDKHFYRGIDGFVTMGARRRLRPECIREACIKVYENHHNSQPYSDMDILRHQVYTVAGEIQRMAPLKSDDSRITSLEYELYFLKRSKIVAFFDSFASRITLW